MTKTGPVLSRFDRFRQIGPRASGNLFLYYEVKNKMKCHKLNPFISTFLLLRKSVGKEKICAVVGSRGFAV